MRLLCAAPANRFHRIDAFLVCVNSDDVGFISKGSSWKSKLIRLIAASGGVGGRQEHLLLVNNKTWIETEQGYWMWNIQYSRSGRPRVELVPVDPEIEELER
jgi:hypothetical protein